MVTQNRLPLPSSLSTPNSPIKPTSCLKMASPAPVPPYTRVVDTSACVNFSKIFGRLLGRHANAAVFHTELNAHMPVGPASPTWRA